MGLIKSGGLLYNGSTQYSSRSVVSTVTNNFSVVCWVNIQAYGGSSTAFFNNGSNDANGYELRISSAGVFSFDISFVANVSSGYTLNTGTWYQVAVIRDSGSSQCYVDASAQGSSSASTPNTPSVNTTIGASQNSAGTASRFCNVIVDDVRFYERAITTTELSNLYTFQTNPTSANTDIDKSNLKIWYKLDYPNTTIDSSGSGLTISHTATPNPVDGNVKVGYTYFKQMRPYSFGPGIAR